MASSNPSGRVYNFSAGPCCLPECVLEEAKADLLNWKGCGLSVMEMSHRGKHFLSIYRKAVADLREILAVPESHEILLLQGGASLQFSGVPLNLTGPNPNRDATTSYVVTGIWSQKAFEEATKYSSPQLAASSADKKYTAIPPVSTWNIDPNTKYLHYCANETIQGVEFKSAPTVDVPLVADMSSNFCSQPVDVAKHLVIYAGVQKNLGPAGATVVIVDKNKLKEIGGPMATCPTVTDYNVMIKAESMFNTPPCWSIYMTGLVAAHIKSTGGLAMWKEKNEAKSKMIYDIIEGSGGFYSSPVDKACQSMLNIPFRIKDNEALEKAFVEKAESEGLVNLSGHRSVGGCRASLYNGMPLSGVEALADFMKTFQEAHRE